MTKHLFPINPVWVEVDMTKEDWDNATNSKGLISPLFVSLKWAETSALVASFMLIPMPGCCGVVISRALYNRNGSIPSDTFHKVKAEVARQLGYSLMLATCELRNFPEVIGAGKNGWQFVHAFRNKRTDHELGLMLKDL